MKHARIFTKGTFIVLLPALLFLFLPAVPAESGNDGITASDAGWSVQVSGTTNDLRAVDAVDTQTAWAVGANGTIARTTNGGATWLPGNAGTVEDLRDVDAADAEVAWAVSGSGRILKTEDGGATWPVAYETAGVNLSGVACGSRDRAWAVGTRSAGDGIKGVILSTGNGGETWSIQHEDDYFAFWCVSAVDGENAWVGGGTLTPMGYGACVYRTTDGENWTRLPVGNRYPFACIATEGPHSAWVGSEFGLVARTTDGGETWTSPLNGLLYYVRSVSAGDSSSVWAIVGNTVLHSTDGGALWGAQDCAPASDLSAADANTAWAVGAGGSVLFTSDGGGATAPYVSWSFPSSGAWGTEVCLKGIGFGAVRGDSFVSFGTVQAVEYSTWSDMEIRCLVPWPALGDVPLTVTAGGASSDPRSFAVAPAALAVSSVAPTYGVQGWDLEITGIDGCGFLPGAGVRLERGDRVIGAYDVTVTSSSSIRCRVNLAGADLGRYDVVVENPGGEEARFAGAFSVTDVCGGGAGTSLALFGLMMGLLSIAGSAGARLKTRGGKF